MRKEWFENWFDSPYYHKLYSHRDDREARLFIEKLVGVLEPPPEARFLDLACGRGRHSLYLAELGYEVVGLDLSHDNIRYARQFETDRLTFYQHDMRKPFRTNYFDFVVNFFTSFGYFEREKDHLRTLESMHLALKKGGKSMIDFFNSHKVLEEGVPEEKEGKLDGMQVQISKEELGGYIVKNIEILKNNRRLHFQERIRAFTLVDFRSMFEKTGFDLCDAYGGYDLEPYDQNTSNRLIMIARKP